MYETRVNLKHLLEDIRDSFALPIEEVIITELVANALDSKAKTISFFIDTLNNSLTVVDDGKGMRRDGLKNYHNIAATTKHRGEGIGFAGVGAKLSLLLASSVNTETKGGHGSRAATVWHLASDTRAPWKFIPFSNKVQTPRGTAVSINFPDSSSPLLSPDFLEQTILKHFLPIFLPDFQNKILKCIYPKGVAFNIEGRTIQPLLIFNVENLKTFQIKFKGQRGTTMGYGFLTKNQLELPENLRGLAISTFGKIIKRGWEWLGINPNNNFISGLVEIPAMAALLTTNKTDFLQDSASLKKYYRFRKTIQEAALPILAQFGEEMPLPQQQKKFHNLAKEIERTLSFLLKNFPELTSLIGLRKSPDGFKFADQPTMIDFIKKEAIPQQAQQQLSEETKPFLKEKTKDKQATQSKLKSPKITIGFEENENKEMLGRMIESTIWVNKKHPAYQKSLNEDLEDYHILLTVAWTLSSFIEQDRSPQDFISQFLASWGKEKQDNLLFIP